ncbi:MAG: [FeFe] hydrogenase, group A [Bacteroidales bacterium]
MNFEIEVNKTNIPAKKGETILSALEKAGIKVPTICSMKDFSPTGACRMCVVEIEGRPNLVPACSYPVEEWMKIKTHSPRVIKARKTIVELLLANHPDDCLYCERNGNCELQDLAEELNVRERRIPGKKTKYKIDKSSASIIKEPSKCILCGRCVRVCEELQSVSTLDFINRGSNTLIATAFNKDLNFSNCINCGQCVMVCPTGALVEKINFQELESQLHDPAKTVVVQHSPTVSVSLAEEFGLKPGKDINGLINAALRKIGFSKVFETAFGTDLTILEECEELLERIDKKENLPMFSSCCPGWIKYMEEFEPSLLPLLASTKSPQQVLGTIIKNWLSERENLKPTDIFSVSIMPCTAKKFEAQRVEMTSKGISDIDAVITTRELARLIRLHGIDLNSLEPELPDNPMQTASSAGKIVGTSGGLMESVIRTLHFRLAGKEMKDYKIQEVRGAKEYKEYQIKIKNEIYHFAVINSLKNIRDVLQRIKNKEMNLHFIEVMACENGCINGGGQPIRKGENGVKYRMKALYDADEKEMIRVAHKNPQVQQLYQEFLGKPLGEKCKKLLHTTYVSRKVPL